MYQFIRQVLDARSRRTYDTSTAHLLIVAPTERELAGTLPSRITGFGVATVGLGQLAAKNLRKVLVARPPQVVLSVGFAGALKPEFSTGDIVVSRQASTVQLPNRLHTLDSDFSQTALKALQDAGLKASSGNVLTVPKPLVTEYDKQAHGLQTKASIADMESYWIVQECLLMNVPIASIRVILDEMSHELPDLVSSITADNGEHEWRHAIRAMLKPTSASSLLPLAIRSRKATMAIKAAIRAVIPALTKDAPLRAVYR